MLLGVVERVTQEVELVVDDMFVETVGNDRVQCFHLGAGAIHLLDHAHGHHAGAETGHVGSLAHLLQRLFDHSFVVGFFNIDFDGDQVVSFRALCDVHFLYTIDCLKLVRMKGLEPLLREKLDPKSSASTNSATPAGKSRF